MKLKGLKICFKLSKYLPHASNTQQVGHQQQAYMVKAYGNGTDFIGVNVHQQF